MFAHDQVPKLDRSQRRPFALVVNTDPSDKPGKHWHAFFPPAEHNTAPIEMFDSYGFSPSMHSLAHVAPRLYSSSVTYQSLDSSVCGHYCLFFLFKIDGFLDWSDLAFTIHLAQDEKIEDNVKQKTVLGLICEKFTEAGRNKREAVKVSIEICKALSHEKA